MSRNVPKIVGSKDLFRSLRSVDRHGISTSPTSQRVLVCQRVEPSRRETFLVLYKRVNSICTWKGPQYFHGLEDPACYTGLVLSFVGLGSYSTFSNRGVSSPKTRKKLSIDF